jgi:hypothetical protein
MGSGVGVLLVKNTNKGMKNALEQFGEVDSEYINSLPQSRIKVL